MFYHTAFLLLALSTSAIASNVCGTVGIHDDSKIPYYMGNFFYKGPSVATVTLCASWCRKDAPKCKAFRWSYYKDSASQYCEFFDNGLDGNFTADSSQDYYYDIGCPIPTFADVSTSTVTTRIASTTVTQNQYQTTTTTSTLPASTQYVFVTQTTTQTPEPETRTSYTTLTSATTQTTTQTQRVNQTITTTLTQSARTVTQTQSMRTITQPQPQRTTTVSKIVLASPLTIARVSTVLNVRVTTVTSVRTVTATRQIAGAALGATAKFITRTVTRVF